MGVRTKNHVRAGNPARISEKVRRFQAPDKT
jgi:hypothetical protein